MGGKRSVFKRPVVLSMTLERRLCTSRNAVRVRTRDTIGRKQKLFFGRKRLDMLAKGISGAPQPNITRSVLDATRKGPEDIALAHAIGKRKKDLPRNDILIPVLPSTVSSRQRKGQEAHTSSSGRSEILDKLDVSERK